jgi:hypothetical protein
MKIVTLNIDEKLSADIQKLAEKNQQTKEEYIVNLLEYKLLEEFVSNNQSTLNKKAGDAGFKSEDDILNNIS